MLTQPSSIQHGVGLVGVRGILTQPSSIQHGVGLVGVRGDTHPALLHTAWCRSGGCEGGCSPSPPPYSMV